MSCAQLIEAVCVLNAQPSEWNHVLSAHFWWDDTRRSMMRDIEEPFDGGICRLSQSGVCSKSA